MGIIDFTVCKNAHEVISLCIDAEPENVDSMIDDAVERIYSLNNKDWVIIIDQGYYGNPADDTAVIGPMTQKEASDRTDKLVEHHEKRGDVFSCFPVQMSEPMSEEEFASYYDDEDDDEGIV